MRWSMNYKELIDKHRGKRVGLFVDEANLFYSQRTAGWRIDWAGVLEFFEQSFDMAIVRYYLGMPLEKEAYDKNVLIKDRLKKSGFEVIEKPLKKIYLDGEKRQIKYKCNFDVEITRDVIRRLDAIDVVLLASSDSDFIGLRNDAIACGKEFIFVCFERNAAWEIHRSHHIFFEDIRDKIEYRRQTKTPEINPG